MGKDKHNPPQKKEPNFIKFSKVQQAYINEVRNRQINEFNEVIGSVYEELGIMEKILKSPPGTYTLRKDYSGLDVLPVNLEEKKDKLLSSNGNRLKSDQ